MKKQSKENESANVKALLPKQIWTELNKANKLPMCVQVFGGKYSRCTCHQVVYTNLQYILRE